MTSTKSYYVDINRFSAQDSESDTTNIWDYNLNDTIVAPAGSEVSIHQAFINQKGITGQSIEIEEDINETINYFAYIAEQDHSVPILGVSSIDKNIGKKVNLNGQYDTHLDLLNNADVGAGETGREGLWGFAPPIGTRTHLTSYNFGGSGAPLILSSKPEFDQTQTTEIYIDVVNPDEYIWNGVSASGGTDGLVATINGSSTITFSGTREFGALIRGGALIEGSGGAGSYPTGIAAGTKINAMSPAGIFPRTATLQDASGNPVVSTNTGNHQMKIKNSGNGFDDGKFTIYNVNTYPLTTSDVIEIGMRFRFKNTGGSGLPMNDFVSQNYNLQVKSVLQQYGTFTFGYYADPLNTTTQNVIQHSATNVVIEVSPDPKYYITPKVLTSNIFVKKGTYGIEQLVSIINNQFNGLYKDKTQIPTNPITEALIGQNWNGLLNSTENGLTQVITPIGYTAPPDNVIQARINPTLIDTIDSSYPDHTFIPAHDYAGLRKENSNHLVPNKYDFLGNITGGGKGYVGYIQNNDISSEGIGGALLTGAHRYTPEGDPENGAAPGVYGSGISKRVGDYQLIRGFSVGAPEFNIQYDTDLSAFSLNNLHSSYRIASHDKQGNPNTNSGEVAVGIKSVTEIADAYPWSDNQSIFGSSAASASDPTASEESYSGTTQSGTNVINNIQATQGADDYESEMFLISINGKITQTSSAHSGDFPTGGDVEVLDFYSYQRGTMDPTSKHEVNSFICELPVNASTNNNGTFTNTRDINFKITGNPCDTTKKNIMKQSFEKPLSRTGGVIVYNFAYETALKYGDRRSVVDSAIYNPHASFKEFFSSDKQARKIWKTKTLWGKLGFTYEQLNDEDYFENIIMYTYPTDRKIRGITTDTQVDLSTIPSISTQNNSSVITLPGEYGGAKITNPQNFNNFDTNRPRTAYQRQWGKDSGADWCGGETATNQFAYSGSPYNMATCINVISKPTPIAAQTLPTLSRFGYYLITSDLVPTYKDIVAKGDPLGLLGVVPKTSLSNQDFIPLATSDLVQVLNQDTIINNIRVKVLNPDLSNPVLSKNSAIILRIDTPILQPQKNTEEETKTPKKK